MALIFFYKCFYGSGQYPCKMLTSQLFSDQRQNHLKFSDMVQTIRSCSAQLSRTEKLIFCMDPILTPRNICAKNQRHLATFLLLSVKAENGYLLRWYTYESNFYTKMFLKGCSFQKYKPCLHILNSNTFAYLGQCECRWKLQRKIFKVSNVLYILGSFDIEC